LKGLIPARPSKPVPVKAPVRPNPKTLFVIDDIAVIGNLYISTFGDIKGLTPFIFLFKKTRCTFK
jgi:hypothetical protein